MARYIDVDKLIAEYDRVHIGAPGGARKLMVDAPTADVVPRSEMSIVVVQNMALENTNVDLQRRLVIAEAAASAAVGKASEMIVEAKREVAREIFEEIENALFNNHCLDEWSDYPTPHYYEELKDDIYELKKKYTEDQHDG